MPTPSTLAPLAAALLFANACAAQWFSITPATVPPVRAGAAIACDDARGNVVMFGGSAAPFGATADTWAFDGRNWSLLAPPAAPPARGGAQMAFDSLRSVIVLFGGLSASAVGGPSFNDTWEFDGATWTQRTTTTTPFRSGRHGMAFDPIRGRTVVYGGIGSTLLLGASNQTWEYDGVNWQQRTPLTNPGTLDGPAMCFSDLLGKCVLFGGVAPVTGAMNSTTWLWDGTAWTQAVTTGAVPQPRYQATMCYDASRGVCVLHGGVTAAGTVLDDTWEWNGANWTLVAATGPGARRMGSMAFDRVRGMTVLFGGSGSISGTSGALRSDTWTFGPSYAPYGQGCVGSAGVPSLRASIGPRLGQTFSPVLTNLIPSSPLAVIATGFSDADWLGVPLPLDMTSSGIPGCSLWMAADLIDVIGAQNGIGQLLLAIPADPWFLGVTFYQQGFSFEVPGFNAFGGVLSNAARARIGI